MKIEKLEYYLPQKTVSNLDLQKEFPNWDSEKTETKIGVSQRHIASTDETALDLGEKAALKVLKDYDKNDIDFLLFCTQSPDYFLPTSACILQERLKLNNNIGALDYNLGCSGYIYGLGVTKGLISANIAKKVLLITAETYSKHIYVKDIANRSIFGDGAAATIISKDKDIRIGEFALGTDGRGQNNLITKNGGFRFKQTTDAEEIKYGTESIYTENNIYMNGPEIFNFTIENVPTVVHEVLVKNDTKLEDIDFFIFHQANKYMLNYLRRKINIPKEKFYIDLQETGNTVSSTIPIALKKSIDNNLVKSGDKIMLVGFGVGYSWGATIITL